MTLHKNSLKNLIPFKPGKSGNPNGNPRKLISTTIKALDEVGIKAASKAEITDIYLRLINCTQKEVRELHNDPNQSMLIKIVASKVADKKGFDIIEKMLDRSVGKPQQDVGIKVDPNIAPLNFIIDDGEDLS